MSYDLKIYQDQQPAFGSRVRNFAGEVVGRVGKPGPGLIGSAHRWVLEPTPEAAKRVQELYRGEG